MYNVYVKRIFVITEIVHMNAGVNSESRERKRLKSLSHSHEAWHPRSTPTSGAGSGASQIPTPITQPEVYVINMVVCLLWET